MIQSNQKLERWQNFHYRFKITLVYFLLLTTYIFIGTPIFWAVEGDAEIKSKELFLNSYSQFFKTYGNSSCLNWTELETLLDLVAKNPRRYFHRNRAESQLWNIFGSFFFSLVIVSTTGFGNQVPTNELCRVLVILYSIIGIPLFLTTVSKAADSCKALDDTVKTYLPARLQKYDCLVPVVFSILNFVVLFIIPTIIFKYMEKWSFREAMYFTYVALTTIGFGDYVPGGHNDGTIYKIFVITWFIFGFAFIGMISAYAQKLVEFLLARVTPSNYSQNNESKVSLWRKLKTHHVKEWARDFMQYLQIFDGSMIFICIIQIVATLIIIISFLHVKL